MQVTGVKRQVMSAEFQKPDDMTMNEVIAGPIKALMDIVQSQAPAGSAINIASVSVTSIAASNEAVVDLLSVCRKALSLLPGRPPTLTSMQKMIRVAVDKAEQHHDRYFLVCVIEQIEFAPEILMPSQRAFVQ